MDSFIMDRAESTFWIDASLSLFLSVCIVFFFVSDRYFGIFWCVVILISVFVLYIPCSYICPYFSVLGTAGALLLSKAIIWLVSIHINPLPPAFLGMYKLSIFKVNGSSSRVECVVHIQQLSSLSVKFLYFCMRFFMISKIRYCKWCYSRHFVFGI